jgi:hypothetical protein
VRRAALLCSLQCRAVAGRSNLGGAEGKRIHQQILYDFATRPNEKPPLSVTRVGLVQLVRFLLVELIYLGLNLRFDMSVIFMINYSFSGR